MRLSRNMQWAAPFIEAVSDLVPLSRVVSIRGYSVPLDKTPQADAFCSKLNGRYWIQIRLTERENGKRLPIRLEDLLVALAHELAHTKEWEHTPEHLYLTACILKRFAVVTAAQRVQDTNKRLVREAA